MEQHFLSDPRPYKPSELLELADISAPPVDLEQVLKTIGIARSSDIDFEKLNLSGYIRWTADRKGVDLWVNPVEADVRQRFTLAHELGHLFKHMLPHFREEGEQDSFEDTPPTFRRDGSVNDQEREANKFAAELLMPEAMLRKYAFDLAKQKRDENGKISMSRKDFIATLSKKFEVSRQSMEIRLKTIGVLK